MMQNWVASESEVDIEVRAAANAFVMRTIHLQETLREIDECKKQLDIHLAQIEDLSNFQRNATVTESTRSRQQDIANGKTKKFDYKHDPIQIPPLTDNVGQNLQTIIVDFVNNVRKTEMYKASFANYKGASVLSLNVATVLGIMALLKYGKDVLGIHSQELGSLLKPIITILAQNLENIMLQGNNLAVIVPMVFQNQISSANLQSLYDVKQNVPEIMKEIEFNNNQPYRLLENNTHQLIQIVD
jgi:hypothetical protein